MASNTPNFNLYKKDPVADKDDTFNISTMLNENWDKIDLLIKQALDQKLSLTGGTLTGDLKIKNVAPIVELEETDTGKKFFIVVDGSTISIREDSIAGASFPLNFDGQTNVLSTLGNKIWHEGNDGAGSGLDADSVRGVKFYRSFEELGITRGQETIEGIVVAMADDSVLLEGIGTGWNTAIYPNGNGTLFIKKVSVGRTDIEFTSNLDNKRWLKKYYDNGTGTVIVTDWERVATTQNSTIIVDNTNWVWGEYGAGMSYRKIIPITGVTATDTVGFYPTLATKQIAQDANVSHIESYTGGVYLYSESIPSGSITFDYRVVK